MLVQIFFQPLFLLITLGTCFSAAHTIPFPDGYSKSYPGISIHLKLGKVAFNKSSDLPLEPKTTSTFFSKNTSTIGIHRVACPKPQSSGAMSIFLISIGKSDNFFLPLTLQRKIIFPNNRFNKYNETKIDFGHPFDNKPFAYKLLWFQTSCQKMWLSSLG